MRICVAGKNNIAIHVCDYIQRSFPELELYAMPNQSDKGDNTFQRSFLSYIRQKNIRQTTLEEIYDWEDLVFLSLEFDQLIKPHKFRSSSLFNIHFSLLPAYKGMYTSALPILHHQKETGVTFHCIDSGIDTGPIIVQKKISIDSCETAKSLYEKYTLTGTQVVIDTLPSILSHTFTARPQPQTGSTYYSKAAIDYAHLEIDTQVTAFQLDGQIRAFQFRDYQLPSLFGYDLFYTQITTEKSLRKAGTLLEDTSEYLKLATIDYNILVYKDRLAELLDYCRKDDLSSLQNVKDICRYLEEREKKRGWSLLMVAAYHHAKSVVRYLLSLGSDVNACNYNGTTVLMYAKEAALRTGDTEILHMLLEQGANPGLCDYSGKNLWDYLEKQSEVILKSIQK